MGSGGGFGSNPVLGGFFNHIKDVIIEAKSGLPADYGVGRKFSGITSTINDELFPEDEAGTGPNTEPDAYVPPGDAPQGATWEGGSGGRGASSTAAGGAGTAAAGGARAASQRGTGGGKRPKKKGPNLRIGGGY